MPNQSRRSVYLSPDELAKITTNDQSHYYSFFEAVQIFLQDCELRNCRDETIKYYDKELAMYKKILNQQQIEPDIYQTTEHTIQIHIIKYMKDMSRKISTINTRLRAIRTLYNFLEKKKYIQKSQNPFHEVKLLRDREPIMPTLERHEVEKLINQPDVRTFVGLRDKTILMLFIETGLRVNEMTHIRVQHLKLHENRILVADTKGYRQRYVPIQKTMVQQLKMYLAIRGEVNTDFIWLNQDNNPLSKHQIQVRVHQHGKQAGIEVGCHKLRHTFARMAVENGADIFYLQSILGHSSMQMVKRYVNLFSKDIISNHNNFSPVEDISRKRR